MNTAQAHWIFYTHNNLIHSHRNIKQMDTQESSRIPIKIQNPRNKNKKNNKNFQITFKPSTLSQNYILKWKIF